MHDLYNRTIEVRSGSRSRERERGAARTSRKPRSLNFESYASEANRIIYEIADELDTDRDSAGRIMRSVMHAVRDRLPPIDAVQFGQGLPMALKGVFFDRYNIAKTPVKIRSAEKFIDYICMKDDVAAEIDFPDDDSVVKGIRGVFRVLERNMDWGQVNQIKFMINREITELIDPDFHYADDEHMEMA